MHYNVTESTIQAEQYKKIVYLHIGLAKTGTTAIQDFLLKNKGALEQHGYFVPIQVDSNCTTNWYSLVDKMAEEVVRYRQLLPRDIYGSTQYYWYSLYDQLAATSCKYSIVSAEALALQHADVVAYGRDILQEIFSQYSVRVICYLRNFVGFFPSIYNQNIKVSHLPEETYLSTIKKSLYSSLGDPCQILDFYADIFGKDSLIIRKYDKENLINGDSVSDFCHVIGCDKYIKPKKMYSNSRIPNEYIPLKRTFDVFQQPHYQYNAKILENIRQCSEEYTLSDNEISVLKKNAQKLFAKYGVDISHNLDDLKSSPFPTYSPEVHFQIMISSLILNEVQRINRVSISIKIYDTLRKVLSRRQKDFIKSVIARTKSFLKKIFVRGQ